MLSEKNNVVMKNMIFCQEKEMLSKIMLPLKIIVYRVNCSSMLGGWPWTAAWYPPRALPQYFLCPPKACPFQKRLKKEK
jgi:hypothetical protein